MGVSLFSSLAAGAMRQLRHALVALNFQACPARRPASALLAPNLSTGWLVATHCS
jgi:hypothetical protein